MSTSPSPNPERLDRARVRRSEGGSFMLVESERQTLSHEAMDQFEREGYLILPGYLGASEVAEIRRAFMEQAKDGPVAGLSDTSRLVGPGDPLSRHTRMMNPHRAADKLVGPVSLRHMLASRLRGILRDLMHDGSLAA